MIIKGAVLYRPNAPLAIEELVLKEPGYGEVLVKLHASGVCHTDWHMIKGDWGTGSFPIVLGHEGAGVVESAGKNVRTVKEGDHVILSWRASCGICEMCERGFPNLCTNLIKPSAKPLLRGKNEEINRFINLGTFATHTVVPEVAAVTIDRDIPFAQASLLGCGVMTGVGAVINTAKVTAGSSVAVFGCGGVGLNCIQGARIAGATLIVAVDLSDFKLQLAREFGATHTVNGSLADPVERIRELTGGLGVHYAFEAIGLAEEPYLQSVLCTRSRGVTVWVGHPPTDTKVTIDVDAMKQEKTITMSLYGSARPHVDFPRLIDLYKTKKLKLDELVSQRHTLEEVDKCFEALAKGQVARSVIVFT